MNTKIIDAPAGLVQGIMATEMGEDGALMSGMVGCVGIVWIIVVFWMYDGGTYSTAELGHSLGTHQAGLRRAADERTQQAWLVA